MLVRDRFFVGVVMFMNQTETETELSVDKTVLVSLCAV